MQGAWNYTQGTIDGGKKISNDANLMTLACAGGAISKCASDKATQSPLTPSYSGTISQSAYTWVQKGAWIVYPGENHGLSVPSYLVHRMRSNIAWYDQWLKGAK